MTYVCWNPDCESEFEAGTGTMGRSLAEYCCKDCAIAADDLYEE